MFIEALVWHLVAEKLPDADTTVLLSLSNEAYEPVWPGYYDGAGQWYLADAVPETRVVAWAAMPTGEGVVAGTKEAP